MDCTPPGVTPDGGSVEGAPVLEPIEHPILGKPLDGCLQERMLVLEPLEHSDFPPDGFSAGRECDYIRLAPLARSSVCTRTVTGSLLFGSPHILVRSSLCSAVLSLRWIDDLEISKESTDIPQNHHLETIVGRSTPYIFFSVWTVRVGIYLLPLSFARILIICCCFYRIFRARDMASGRSPDRDQAGPSYAPSDPLPGTFLGLSLDIRSEKL